MFNLGKNKFRSPVDIDISNLKIDPIISQLKTMGIDDYEIETIGGEELTNSTKNNSNIIIVDDRIEDINKLNSRIDDLESLLHNHINKENEREQNNIHKLPKKSKVNKPDKKLIKKIVIKKNIENEYKTEKDDDEIINKKVIIEELDMSEEFIVCDKITEPPPIQFKIKNFQYEDIINPFKISSDIEKLVKFKK